MAAAPLLFHGTNYDATVCEVLPLGDGLPHVHLPPAGLSALGVPSGGIVLVRPADSLSHAQLSGGKAVNTAAQQVQQQQDAAAVANEHALGGRETRPVAVAAFAAPRPKLRAGDVAASAAVLDALRAGGHVMALGAQLRVFGVEKTAQGEAAPVRCQKCTHVTLRLLQASEASGLSVSIDTAELEDALRRTSLSTPPSTGRSPVKQAGKTPASASSASPSSTHHSAGANALSVAWIRRAMDDPWSLQLLETLACRHMAGRPVAVGTTLPLSLLGRHVHVLVADVRVPGPSAGLADASLQSSDCVADVVYVCAATVRVQLVAWDTAEMPQPPSAPALPLVSAEDATREQVQQQAAQDALARALARATLATAAHGFDGLAGVADAVAALTRLVVLPLTRPQLFASSGLRPPRGVLLHGPPGCGKTRLAMAAAAQARVLLFVISGPELNSEYSGEAEARLRGVFQAAAQAAFAGEALVPGFRRGAVVLIDEIDALAPARGDTPGGSASTASVRCVTQLLTLLDGGHAGVPLQGISVVAATNRVDALDPALRRPGRFDAEVHVRAPGAQGRAAILDAKLRGVPNNCVSPDHVALVASSLHGYTGADIEALVAEAAMLALRRSIHQTAEEAGRQQEVCRVTPDDLAAAQRIVRPSVLREVRVEVPPSACWDDVAGLDDVKARLAECLGAHAHTLARLGVKPPRGVLLFGPPGCAKTTLARAVAARGGWNFICVAGSDVFSQWVGESEKAVAALFARAREASPCVLFLDELDALAPVRGASGDDAGTGPVDRVLAQLLIELDGGVGHAGGGGGSVMLLAATNRPDLVDPALLRPGRVDRLLYVPPPSTPTDREAVLRVHLRRTPLAQDVDLAAVAAATPGFTGADLAAVCREACLAALTEDLDAPCVCARHLDAAARAVVPSKRVSPDLEALYARMARG